MLGGKGEEGAREKAYEGKFAQDQDQMQNKSFTKKKFQFDIHLLEG